MGAASPDCSFSSDHRPTVAAAPQIPVPLTLSTGAPHTWHHSPAPRAAAVLGFLCQEQPGHPPAQAQSWAAGSAFQSQRAAPVSSHRL